MGNIKDVHINTAGLQVNISAARLEHNLVRAMDMLGERILQDCNQFIPKAEGILKNSGYVESEGENGTVVWDGPYAHYQHEGILYVGEETGSAFAKEGERKIPAVPERKLEYGEPGRGDHWFERAYQQYGQQWIDMVRKEAGK